MNHSSQAPGAVFSSHAPASRGLRLWARATRWLLWLMVAVWGFGLLTWVALHAAIVPRIDGWRPELQRWASDALGVPVTIGSIRATNRPDTPFSLPPLMPAFELSDVRLLDAQGREVTGERIPAVTTSQIYKGSIAFIILQLIMVAVVVAYPGLVTDHMTKATVVDDAAVTDMLNNMPGLEEEAPAADEPAEGEEGPAPAEEEKEEDPAKALLESMKK